MGIDYFDFDKGELIRMEGRVRLCPFYFGSKLAAVLATICPADKKIIHGMTDAIFAPCSA